MGETHLKNMVNSSKENKRDSCSLKGCADRWESRLPPTTDITFKSWAGRNLRVIDQLLCDTGVHPFAYLQDKFFSGPKRYVSILSDRTQHYKPYRLEYN